MNRLQSTWVVGAMSIVLLMAIRHDVLTLSFPWPVDYGEGVNLLWAQQADQHAALYPEVSTESLPWLHNPYTPLYPILTSLVSPASIQRPFLPGRLVSFVSMLLLCALIYRLARRTLNGPSACLLSLGFSISPLALRYGTMMRVDMLAVGLSISAILLSRRPIPRHSFGAGLFASLALFTKPSAITASLFLLCMLVQYRKGPLWGAAALGGLLPVLLFFHPSLRPLSAISQHLFTLQHLPWEWSHFFDTLARWTGTHAPLIVLGVLALSGPANHFRLPVGLSLIPLALTLGIAGSDQNYFLELTALLFLSLAASLPFWIRRSPTAITGLILLQLFLWLPLPNPPVFTRTYGQEIGAGSTGAVTPGQADRDIGMLLDAELSSLPAPVYASEPGWLLKNGQPLQVQPYQFGGLMQQGRWPEDALKKALQANVFSAILLKGTAEKNEAPYLPENLQKDVLTSYSLYRVIGPWHLYLSNDLDFDVEAESNDLP